MKLLKMPERNILIHVTLFIKWRIYEKKKKRLKVPVRKQELVNPIIYIPFRCVIHLWKSVQICMIGRRDTNLLLSVKCNVEKTVENVWKEMKLIRTFQNLHLNTVKNTRQWLRDLDSQHLHHTSQSQGIFGFKAFAKNTLHH